MWPTGDMRHDRRVSTRRPSTTSPRRLTGRVFPATLALSGALLLTGPLGGQEVEARVQVTDPTTAEAFGFGWLDVPALSPIPGDPSGHVGLGAAVAMCAIGLAGTAAAVASSRRDSPRA